ncbi:MAG: hypothetical protein NTZ37_04160 [Methanoregula sp.]|jgi:uncharacterized membrane protein|nr:hypothetical protein [Methanoregula sp.]
MVLIVDDLLRLPLDLGMKVLEAIADDADAMTLSTERAVREQVLRIQMQFERGDLPEEEYRAAMNQLRKRLDEVKGV